MKRNVLSILLAAALGASILSGCAGIPQAAPAASAPEATEETAEAEAPEAEAQTGEVVLKCVADLTPHSEILNAAADQLAEKGIKVDIVSSTWDATWNDMLVDGEIDFAYFMHVPAMHSIEEEMGTTLYSMGGIHVEP
ncbi:MAG: metal ABC transporter substrate-binding protein, partial [Lachnospiraceae bacterium]|nr:metal ABC transporter substrate-binding protein [Lachnospiraceae bacterium]